MSPGFYDITWEDVAHWDRDVQWADDLVEASPVPCLDLDFVRDDHLKVTNGTAEDAYIGSIIKVADAMAERFTRRSLMPQDRKLTMDRFPRRIIRLPMPPLVEVTRIAYVDGDGAERVLALGTDYVVSAPVGPRAKPGRIAPAYGTVWPTTRCQMDAVTVEYRAGYVLPGTSPETADVPDEILQGQLLVVGELYKQRSLSVQAPNNTPAVIAAERLWHGYRAY